VEPRFVSGKSFEWASRTVGATGCDNHTVEFREDQKCQDTELNSKTQSRFKS
jgi:hypothetical protein